MTRFSGILLLAILGCHKPEPTADSGAMASATAAASGSSAASVTPSASAARTDALAVCNQILAAKVGSACDAMPPVEGADAAQLTLKSAGHTWYAGAFVYPTAAAHQAGVAKMKAEPVGAKRKPPTFLTNDAARVLVVVDGEVDAKDVATIRKVVSELH